MNGELDAVRAAVPAALDALTVGGRIVVLSYHSLEDRIVKQAFAALAEDRTPVGLPVPLPDRGAVAAAARPRGRTGVAATEIEDNPRAASVRLRAAERIRESA